MQTATETPSESQSLNQQLTSEIFFTRYNLYFFITMVKNTLAGKFSVCLKHWSIFYEELDFPTNR